MKCSNCGKNIEHVLVDEFQYDGTDRDTAIAINDLGDNCYNITVTHNWTGDGLDDEDVYDTIICPFCRKFPFKSREIQREEAIFLTCWNE